MAKKAYDDAQLTELLLEALETELGGIQVYTAAVSAAVNEDLKKEWEDYLRETKKHKTILLNVFKQLGLDADAQSAGRKVVKHQGQSLVQAIEIAKAEATPDAAQLVAAECVVLAETKDHQNWELIGHLIKHSRGDALKVLHAAYEEVEKEEDHHLYHTQGWSRELWIESLGLPAVLPPPEEVKQVETAIGAARAEQSRADLL